MIAFLSENIGTILVGLGVLGIVAAIIAKMVRDKRNGKPFGCDCGCSDCPHSSACHTR